MGGYQYIHKLFVLWRTVSSPTHVECQNSSVCVNFSMALVYNALIFTSAIIQYGQYSLSGQSPKEGSASKNSRKRWKRFYGILTMLA